MPQIRSGDVGITFIKEVIQQGLDYFWANLETYLREYIEMFWPYDTGNYHDRMLESIHRTGNDVVIDGAQNVDYAIPVEHMVGVNWTNSITQEQPLAHLKEFLKTKAKELVVDALIQHGLRVLYNAPV